MNRRLAADIGERAAWTFVQAFLSVWVVSSWADMADVGLLRQATVAGVAAVLAVLKGAAASRVGDQTAATLPAEG